MRKTINYFDLGATLYTPCNHYDLKSVVNGEKAQFRSLVLCTEDSIKDDELSDALINLQNSLNYYDGKCSCKIFVRPKNPFVLADIFNFHDVEKIDGFVLPKFDQNNHDLYKNVIDRFDNIGFSYMPILETADVFDNLAMEMLLKKLLPWKNKITCLRIGGNDLMNLLGLKRLPGFTIYESPLRVVIDNLVIKFRLNGFELSAPVFDIVDDVATLVREVSTDLSYGFFAKTAIHPSQLDIIENLFLDYTNNNLSSFQSILSKNSSAVFIHKGQMHETKCHNNWANRAAKLHSSINR